MRNMYMFWVDQQVFDQCSNISNIWVFCHHYINSLGSISNQKDNSAITVFNFFSVFFFFQLLIPFSFREKDLEIQ